MLSGGFNMAVQQGPLPLTEADRIFDLFDTDHDGQLLPEEFQLASRVMRGELPLEIALVWNNQQAMKKHINQMQSELKEMKEMLTNLVAAPHARPQKPKLAKTVRTFEARGWPVQEEALSDSHVIVECFFSMGFPSSLHGSVRIHVGNWLCLLEQLANIELLALSPAWRKFHPLPRPDALAQQAVAEVTSMAREALIMESGEKMAIAQRGPAEYLVDNSALQAHAPGITFRFSKHLEDRDDLGELAAFGSVVLGIDEGDGWLRAQNPSGEIRFLPMEIQGIPVMSRTGAEEQREAFAERRRRKEEAERHQRDLEAWQRRAAEAERLHQERLRAQAERDEKEQSKADLLKPERSGFKGRTESVLERHYAGEEEEAPRICCLVCLAMLRKRRSTRPTKSGHFLT
ncbi:unnamed protein product [Durusdinium trenchii]|uniref:EF-hand domain-containing protein n=1 Tax=Durusdinium trenchii TaxID=1381693 RepID=A0ABP0IPU4_9DINO